MGWQRLQKYRAKGRCGESRILDDEHPSVQPWTDFTFPAIQLAYGHLLEQKMRELESKYREPLTPSPGQKVGVIVDKSSVDTFCRDWTRHIVRAPIRSAGKQLRPSVSSKEGTNATLFHQRIEWVSPQNKQVRLRPDWAAVDGEVEVVYRETHPDDRKIPKPLVYAVGNSKLSQKWKSEWLAMPSDAQVQMDPSLAIKTIRTQAINSQRVLPLNQVAAYCRYAETRYAFILTQRELVALRIRRIPKPTDAAVRSTKHYAAVEYAPVLLTASTGLTANLAIWALACLGMNDGHRAMENPGNTPLDSMTRLTWWKFDGTDRVYENVVSKRQIHESQWKPEYSLFVHLTEKEGRSFTEAFVPQPLSGTSAVEQRFKAKSIGKNAQPAPVAAAAANPSAVAAATTTTMPKTTPSVPNPSTVKPAPKTTWQGVIPTSPGPSIAQPRALPRVPGPKLAPFTPTGHADIEFIEELGNPVVDMDSRVWKVRINGTAPHYALKMFRFNAAARLQTTIGGWLNQRLASPELYIDYFDPFNAECRVYGRLEQENRQDLAVHAHGYLLLTPEQELEVIKRGTKHHPDDPDPEDNPDPWYRMDEPLVHDRPVHAIVKDLATDQNPFSADHVSHICSDLEDLHKLGILVRDIKIGNYLGGKLVDFSRAWTMPNPSFDRIHPSILQEQRQQDPGTLQTCILDWGLGNGWDWDKVDFPEELEACACGTSENDDFGIDPRRYNWRKWEDDLEAVDAFMEHELYGPPEPEPEPCQWVEDEE